MKIIQAATAAALLIVAGGVIPAFGQGRGNGYGGGYNRDDRAQHQGSERGQDRRGSGQEFRGRDAQPQFQRGQQGNWQRQSYGQQDQRQDNYRGGGQEFRERDTQPRFQQGQGRDWQRQGYNEQQYRSRNSYRDGANSYGFASGAGLRWADRGGYRGRFIPQNRFYSSFGRQHFFRIGRPVYYDGFPRFSYGGYAFQILDPVPAYWGPDWYDSDDVYVDYEDGGYYLYNRSYPEVGIAVSIGF